jgi:hypothetical protein
MSGSCPVMGWFGRAPAPPAIEAGKGRQRRGARHVSADQRPGCRHRYRYSFHIVGRDGRGEIVLRQKWSRSRVEARFANMLPCLIGLEACVGAHHLSRRLRALGHDARLMPAKYVRPYSKGQIGEPFAESPFHPPTTDIDASVDPYRMRLYLVHNICAKWRAVWLFTDTPGSALTANR